MYTLAKIRLASRRGFCHYFDFEIFLKGLTCGFIPEQPALDAELKVAIKHQVSIAVVWDGC